MLTYNAIRSMVSRQTLLDVVYIVVTLNIETLVKQHYDCVVYNEKQVEVQLVLVAYKASQAMLPPR